MPEFCMILAKEISEYTNYDFFWREKLTKFPNFTCFPLGGRAHAAVSMPVDESVYFLCNCFSAKH